MFREELNAVFKEKMIEAVLVSDGYNMRYLSGFRGATGYLYITSKRQVLLTDSRYTTQAKEEALEFEVIEISNQKGYGAFIGEMTGADEINAIGFENDHMIYADFMKLKEACSEELCWKGMGDSLNRLRIVKNEKELSCMEKAQSIADGAFSHIIEILKPGMTELQVAAELEFYLKSHGANGTSFDTIAASGIHSAMPHAMPSNKAIDPGDFLTMDFGCIYEGYCSDMTRTVVVGKASAKQKEIYQIVLEAQLAALDVIKAGMRGSEVDKVARDVIEKAGYGEYFGHGLGHSVGLYIHEEPRLSPKCDEVLKENVIETVEPGIYIPEFGGVRIEDIVIVKENGCQNMTHSTKELLEL